MVKLKASPESLSINQMSQICSAHLRMKNWRDFVQISSDCDRQFVKLWFKLCWIESKKFFSKLARFLPLEMFILVRGCESQFYKTSQELRMLSRSLLFKGHNVIVNIVVLNCHNQCQVSGHKSLGLLLRMFSKIWIFSENLNIFWKSENFLKI